VRDTLTQENLKIMPDNIVKSMFRDMASTEYPDCCEIFTDGSKTGTDINPTTVTAAVVVPTEGVVQTWKLPGIMTIFTAELYAIHEALLWAMQSPAEKFAVYTDSLSSVRLLMNKEGTLRNTYQALICSHLSAIKEQGKTLTIEWVPAHRGIPGNEAADAAAKEAHSLPFITIPALPTQDIKHDISRAMSEAWTDYWIQQRNNSRVGNHLALIKQTIKEWPWASIPANRKLETAMTRLRIGHSGLNAHMYRMGMTHTPLCDCGVPETVEHVLKTCPNYDQQRQALTAAVQQIQQPMTLQTLLGGSNAAIEEQKQIISAVNIYLHSTGLLDRV
jgi:ribonuclease HI